MKQVHKSIMDKAVKGKKNGKREEKRACRELADYRFKISWLNDKYL